MMQRLMFSLGATLGAVLLQASAGFAEEAATASPQDQFRADVEECTTRANADALEADGDAQALFYACMSRKGHQEDALSDFEGEEQ